MSNLADIQKRLSSSTSSVFVYAEHLHRRGVGIQIDGMRVARSDRQQEVCRDNGDIYATWQGVSYRIEVKCQSWTQTNFKDYPYKDVIVCNKWSFDRAVEADKKPHHYALLNWQMSHYIKVYAETSDRWYIQNVTDKRRNSTYPVYRCPLELVEFHPIEVSIFNPGTQFNEQSA